MRRSCLMITRRKRMFTAVTLLVLLVMGTSVCPVKAEGAARQMEALNRGLVAVKTDGGIFVSWRFLGTENASVLFNVYRDGQKLNAAPVKTTNYVDKNGSAGSTYTVRAVVNGTEQPASEKASVWAQPYHFVPLDKPAGGTTPKGEAYTYSANDASVGDVDGDGQYELILKWDPSNSKDNSQDGYTGDVLIDAYKLDGTKLWRINLGKNIRAGAHYTQFMVYDLDGDGKAEVAMKTADGTKDGTGKVIGNANADYRNEQGRVLSGPEYLTVFQGSTGKELVTANFEPARGNVSDWGDSYGNRVDRFLAGIAYLDGQRPSLIMTRGYYAKTMLVAYNFRDGKLSKLWTLDSSKSGNEAFAGQGNHNMSIADVDGDGKDEIIFGSMAVDHDGKGMYSTGLGHGDALHTGDLDPGRPGLEVFQVHEDKNAKYGLSFRDAATGKILWGVYAGKDVGRGMAADIDPRYPGQEVWANGSLYSAKGVKIGSGVPSSTNFGIWWDGDLLREQLDSNRIDKWDYQNGVSKNVLTASGAAANNGTKATPALQADLLGDWREEVVWRTEDSSALRIYTTTIPTEHRLYTLMHDPVYRLGIAWQNVAYNQPPHTSFFLGDGMAEQPKPNMYTP
ncbi:rhamnogalacturonan lyase [Bacillus subtilis]|uniref:rhamnogalacturonan lyase n=1 Tax=Bacillus subtilis TaxID=1423 RepID=UPI002DBF7928|nr:rhamnogalacturonan lyase [Bacillus subtilis]MEC1005940.1 rhamnogalacturonan lyase [Bacillus subtilis]MEC1074837.1 rhamnogalacturonan lyase [Bacillus subtilis]